jgi:predicted histidine transporter YuiF (NhaC family)
MQTLLFSTVKVAPMTPFDWIASLAFIVLLLALIARYHREDQLKALEAKKGAQKRRRRHQERKAQEVHAEVETAEPFF